MPDTPKPLITGPILPPLVPAKVTEGYPPGGEDPNGDFQFLKCNREGYVHTVHQDQLDRIEAKLDQLLSSK